MRKPQKESSGRSTYRHGDLHAALLQSALDLAREGGPQAVVLREATRRAGVVPNAAYRHFANQQDLLQAVRSASLAALARAIESEMVGALARLPARRSVGTVAKASLRAVGTGYVGFALDEPGLFRTAFSVPDVSKGALLPEKGGDSGLNPFQLLGTALDKFVVAGLMTPRQRVGADYLAWSAVHGLALLIIDGPLREMPRMQADLVGQRLLDMVEKGLS